MVLPKEDIDGLKSIISSSLDYLYEYDFPLIQIRGMEQSAAFRFAIYLHEEIMNFAWLSQLNLDIEYNKNGEGPKITPRREYGTKPDLIIHGRGHNNLNVLIIEFKHWSNTAREQNDIEKLEDFTNQDGAYKYGLGAFIRLRPDVCNPVYFINGQAENDIAEEVPGID
ncbi:hypothetical protein [Spirosoma panaciterrae]|uniref:hypothetical protein n=1 Tax=Spirosoma panaciterrae TaxID=496058 RepID=UPI00035E1911|nr:hypothetical protein [Spirosoma panaciterrae]